MGVGSSLGVDRPRYVWGGRIGRRWLVESAELELVRPLDRLQLGVKRSEIVVRAITRGGALRLARRKFVPETWMVLRAERYRGR
jgi:hypothetical protein